MVVVVAGAVVVMVPDVIAVIGEEVAGGSGGGRGHVARADLLRAAADVSGGRRTCPAARRGAGLGLGVE